jgi:hypothetical protein
MTEEFYELTLKKDGVLISHKWEYDADKGEGQYVDHDVSLSTYNHLSKYVKIEEGVTLEDLFALVSDESDILNAVFRNCWIKEYIDEWMHLCSMNYQSPIHEYSEDGLEFLELYHIADMQDGYLHIPEYPAFHGLGWELKTDHDSWKKGTRIPWAIEFSPIDELLHLPLKINEEFTIYKDTLDSDWSKDNQVLFTAKKKMTLQDVIGGVFWEIPFCGGPKEKNESREELDKRSDEVKEAMETGDMSKFKVVDLDNKPSSDDNAT